MLEVSLFNTPKNQENPMTFIIIIILTAKPNYLPIIHSCYSHAICDIINLSVRFIRGQRFLIASVDF